MKTLEATGGITIPIITVMEIIIQNHMGSKPNLAAAGKKIGMASIMKAKSSIKEPPNSKIRIMKTIINQGGKGRLAIQSAAMIGIFVVARKWPITVEPAIRTKTIHAVRNASATDAT